MKFIYLGDKESVTTHGYTFSDEPVEVTGNAAQRLSRNSHFQIVEGEESPKKRGRKPKTDTAE